MHLLISSLEKQAAFSVTIVMAALSEGQLWRLLLHCLLGTRLSLHRRRAIHDSALLPQLVEVKDFSVRSPPRAAVELLLQ